MKKTTINNLSDPMNIAFMEAKKAFNKNEVPVGAVVTDKHNQKCFWLVPIYGLV